MARQRPANRGISDAVTAANVVRLATLLAERRIVHVSRVYDECAASTIFAGQRQLFLPAKDERRERRWRPQRNSVIVAGPVAGHVLPSPISTNDAGGGRLWKTVLGFPRSGGRVLCVHGSVSVHGLLVRAQHRETAPTDAGPRRAVGSLGVASVEKYGDPQVIPRVDRRS